MKNLLTSILKFHLFPILIAGGAAMTCLFIFLYFFKPETRTEVISGKQKAFAETFENCAASPQSEIELAGCLENPEVLTIFGSSELGHMEFSPYFFLPKKMNMPTVAFGHAYHQDFSMFCELLAMNKHLKNSKVCIILSPGWFETEGTNIEAFLEFVRPNFLRSIIHNDEIPLEYKLEIGKYISDHFYDIEGPSEALYYFKKLYAYRNIPLLNQITRDAKAGIKNVQYKAKTSTFGNQKAKPFDWEKTEDSLVKAFLAKNNNNKIFVDNAYYTEHILKDGVFKKGNTDDIPVASKNREYQDFLLLVSVLKRYNCDATFIIQPLNPYYYDGLEKFNPIISEIESVLKKNQFPYLNMFVSNEKAYQPATLNDVMHTGDYGWMKINRFLYEQYGKTDEK